MRISDWSSDVCSSDLPLPNRSAKSRMDEYTQQQLGTRCSGQLSIQPNVLGNLSCSALGQHVDQVASGPCPPLDGIDDNLSDLSCSTMPHTPAAACRACVNLFPPPVARSLYRRPMPWPEIGRASCRERVCQTV